MYTHVVLIYDKQNDHKTWVRCKSLQQAQALRDYYDPCQFNVDIHPIGPSI